MTNISKKIQPTATVVVNIHDFNGDCTKGLEFYHTFNSFVNNNPNLTNEEKFYHLKGYLKGDAEKFSQCNWYLWRKIQWSLANIVEDIRYHNNKNIIEDHLKATFQLPLVTKELYVQLRKFIDEFIKHFMS